MEQDLQKTVYSWFDKNGIIANIRTQLRHNLVTALKNHDFNLYNNVTKSAKQYVYDLLVAEYLWNNNYHYSLSILSSEAPLLVNFHNKLYFENQEDESVVETKKLRKDYVCHIMESISIDPKSKHGQSITSNYFKNSKSLLFCILNYASGIDCNEVCNVNFKSKGSKSIKIQTNNSQNMHQEILKMNAIRKKLLKQKNLFDAQLKQKELELKTQSGVIENQFHVLQKKLEEAQSLIDCYSAKEMKLLETKRQEDLRILKKENDLSMREKLVAEKVLRLEKERDSCQQFEGNLKKLQEQMLEMNINQRSQAQNLNLSVKDVSIQTDFESFIFARNEKTILSQEKQDLIDLVQEQQSRIDQLTLKSVHLSRKLEELQLYKDSNSYVLKSPSNKILNSMNTVASETSSTDDILQDAKLRLKRLEEETLKADQYYINCINKLSM